MLGFELGQQKPKFYKAIETDDYNNSLFFYHNKNILPILNKKQDPQTKQTHLRNSLNYFNNQVDFEQKGYFLLGTFTVQVWVSNKKHDASI